MSAATIKGSEGVVLSLGVGYDFWVAPEFSLGVMGRFTYAPLTLTALGGPNVPDDREITASYPTFAPALLLTATYQ